MLPTVLGTSLAVIHFAVVGVPFIESKGAGETVAYLVLFADFPLYLFAELVFQRWLLQSVLFNFVWFVALGTILYFLIGYGIDVLVGPGPANTYVSNASTKYALTGPGKAEVKEAGLARWRYLWARELRQFSSAAAASR